MSEQLVQGMHHTPRTKFIAKVLRARRRVLRLHNMPQDAIPTNEMMDEIVSSLREKFGAEHIPQTRETLVDWAQTRHQRVHSAFNCYVFHAITAKPRYVELIYDRPLLPLTTYLAFWQTIRTNNISSEDRENVKRYEDELRHRNAVITSKIIHLGICLAKAWARSRPAAVAMHLAMRTDVKDRKRTVEWNDAFRPLSAMKCSRIGCSPTDALPG